MNLSIAINLDHDLHFTPVQEGGGVEKQQKETWQKACRKGEVSNLAFEVASLLKREQEPSLRAPLLSFGAP